MSWVGYGLGRKWVPNPNHKQLRVELDVSACAVSDVLDTIRTIATGPVPASFASPRAVWAGGGGAEFAKPKHLADIGNDRPLETLGMFFGDSGDEGRRTGALGVNLSFAGVPGVVDQAVTLVGYRCTSLIMRFFVDATVITPQAWDWIGWCYRTVMALTPVPGPWSQSATDGFRVGEDGLFDEPGTGGTLTTRVPVNVFGRDTSLDPGLHHYGPLVHIAPASLEVIGDPRTQPGFTPLHVEDLTSVSNGHGMVVQMPWPISESELQSWRDYLAPAIRLNPVPKPDVMDLINANYRIPFIPNIDAADFVLESDLTHPALGEVDVAPGEWIEFLEPIDVGSGGFKPGVLPIVYPNKDRDLGCPMSKHRNYIVMNPGALLIPDTGTSFWFPVRQGDVDIAGTDIWASDRINQLIATQPDAFLPILHWKRDRSEGQSAKLDSWEIAILDNNGWSEIVTVAPTKAGRISVTAKPSRSQKVGRQTFANIIERAHAAFGDALADTPNPDRWDNICTSRLDIEQWLGIEYHATDFNKLRNEHEHHMKQQLEYRTGLN